MGESNYKLKINELRIARGLTQQQLAEMIGISQNYLSEIENQKYDIKISLLYSFAEALGVCPYELIDLCIYCQRRDKETFF